MCAFPANARDDFASALLVQQVVAVTTINVATTTDTDHFAAIDISVTTCDLLFF